MGKLEILKQLKELNLKAFELENDFVGFYYKIPLGRFKGQEIVVALNAPQFPNIPPSGPYIKPFLLPINTKGRIHPYGGIHDWKKPTEEFQYWSRPFPGWNNSGMNMKAYLAFLRTLLDIDNEI